MGYRNKISLLDKNTHREIKDLTNKQLEKWWLDKNPNADVDDNYVYVPMYELSEEVHEIGKYWEHKFLKPYKKPIFSKRRTDQRFNSQGEFYIIGQDGLKAIIEANHQKILNFYQDIFKPESTGAAEAHCRMMMKEWEINQFGVVPYDLRLDSPDIVSSWKIEYQIFELVRIYKSIDYNKYEVCITGW